MESSKDTGFLKKYVRTSGSAHFGDRPGEVLTEEDIPTPSEALAWLWEIEKNITSRKDCVGVVVRPPFVYGGICGGKGGSLMSSITPDKITIEGNPKRVWGGVHVDDLAGTGLNTPTLFLIFRCVCQGY